MDNGRQSESPDLIERYKTARALAQAPFTNKLVRNKNIVPRWVGNSSRFVYERFTGAGREHRRVDVEARSNDLAFDHNLLAACLSKASGIAVDCNDLPIQVEEIVNEPPEVTFSAFGKRWRFSPDREECAEVPRPPDNCLASPDGRLAAYVRENNIWLKNLQTGRETQATFDGERSNAYCEVPEVWGGKFFPVIDALWAPDSMRLLAVQLDTRRVESSPVVHYVPRNGQKRPIATANRFAVPGDEHIEQYRLVSIEVEDVARSVAADRAPLPLSIEGTGFFGCSLGWWHRDSRVAYFIEAERGDKAMRVVEFDTRSGHCRVLFEERSDSFVRPLPNLIGSPLIRVLPETNELVWFSDRSGWGHLYLYDLDTGRLKRSITSGEWLVRDILHYEASTRELIIQTAGRDLRRDPYLRDICCVNIDTGDLTVLIESDHDYICSPASVSPDGKYVFATRSIIDELPVGAVYFRNGGLPFEVETADVSALPGNWRWPERVQLKAADGVTDIYGNVFRPSHFSELRQYPVIDYIYNTPYNPLPSPEAFDDWSFYTASALAELGFIVVLLAGRGTPRRSREFQDFSYGWIPSSCHQEDHVSAIRQLSSMYDYINIDRVGIFSEGGATGVVTGMLNRPDFYKVGVVSGVQDTRFMKWLWGERYEGLKRQPLEEKFAEHSVNNLQGKLLLIHGFLDRCNSVAGTLRLVDALHKANKDFDMLLLPNVGHILDGYGLRRAWDYLVTHLLDETPPKGFEIKTHGYFEFLGKQPYGHELTLDAPFMCSGNPRECRSKCH